MALATNDERAPNVLIWSCHCSPDSLSLSTNLNALNLLSLAVPKKRTPAVCSVGALDRAVQYATRGETEVAAVLQHDQLFAIHGVAPGHQLVDRAIDQVGSLRVELLGQHARAV